MIIPKGTVMTCESGHEIAVVKRDIHLLVEPVMPDQFEWKFDTPEPVAGMPIEPCAKCGARYIGHNGLGGHFMHTPDGWIPKADA